MASRKAKPRERTSKKLEAAAPISLDEASTAVSTVLDVTVGELEVVPDANPDRDPNPNPDPEPPPRSTLPALDLEPVSEKTDENETRPSSQMTREVPALSLDTLVSATGSDARLPIAPPTIRAMDQLAITSEAPSAARLLLLDTTEALLDRVAFFNLTEEAIAREASVSIDVFHAHFANKATVLGALADRFCEQTIGVTNESTHSGIWDGVTPRDIIEVSVRSILDVVLGRAALVRAVLMFGDQTMIDGFRRVGSNITARVLRVIEHTHVAPSERPDARDVAFAFLLAVSLAHHAIIVGTEWSGVDFTREELYERATRAATSYLDESMKRARPS